MLSYGESLVPNAGKGARKKEMQAEGEDCASVAGGFGVYSVQDCENVLCVDIIWAIACYDWVVLTENALSITQEVLQETRVRVGLESGGDGDLGGLQFGVLGDV